MIKPLADYPGYRVDENGRVFGKRKVGPLTQQDNGHGYKTIVACTKGERFTLYVHRLVAIAFIPNPDNKPEVDHIDGNRWNNRAENLQWVTHSENMSLMKTRRNING